MANNGLEMLKIDPKNPQMTPKSTHIYAVRVVDGRADLRFSLYTQVKTWE